MSKYTTELRFICESLSGLTESKGYNDIETILETAAPLIFSFDYPIFDDEYKPILEKKILRHFYTREICEETYGLWKLRLEDRMNLIMPYFNELYNTTVLEYDPLHDVSISKTYSKLGTANADDSDAKTRNYSANHNNSVTFGKAGTITNVLDKDTTDSNTELLSDTPQGSIARLDLDGNSYLTQAVKRANTGTDDQTNTETFATTDTTSQAETNADITTEANTYTKRGTSSESYAETIVGKQGTQSYASMVRELRDNLINIDMMIIDELRTLFINLW